MEIEFRGMDVKTKEWVYGNLVQVRDTFSILNINFLPASSLPTFKFIEVIPETVGQYTGQKDKNKQKIYVDDKIHYKNSIESGKGVIECWDSPYSLVVNWFEQKTDSHSLITLLFYLGCCEELEIIGNIHENPKMGNNG